MCQGKVVLQICSCKPLVQRRFDILRFDNHIAGVLNLNACGQNDGRVAQYWRDLSKCSQIPCVAWVIPPSPLGKNRFKATAMLSKTNGLLPHTCRNLFVRNLALFEDVRRFDSEESFHFGAFLQVHSA